MNICQIISTPFPPEEGIGNYVYNLSKKLIEKNHNVFLITRGSLKKKHEFLFDGIKVIKPTFIPLYPLYMDLHGIFLNNAIKKIEDSIDIIHIHSPLIPTIYTNRPIITTIHTPMLTDFRHVKINSYFSLLSKISSRIISFPLEKKLLKNSKIVTTVTDTVANEIKHEYYSSLNNIEVTGNGVDKNKFYFKQSKNTTKKYILFVGRLDKEKGIYDLIETAKFFSDQHNISFLVVGKGREKKKIIKKIKKNNLSEKIELLGQLKQEDLIDIYHKSSIFVLPSYHEGLPSVLLEAMSCGVPVIATDVRGNNDLIFHGINGLLVPPHKPKILAKKISYLLNNHKIQNELKFNARETIDKKYNWDDISNKYIEMYNKIL